MAMTLPYPTWNPGQIVTASNLTTYLNNNGLFLLNGKQVVEKKYRGAANYLTTAGAGGMTWAAVDNTNLTLSVSSSFITGRIWAFAQFWAICNYTDGNATPPYSGFFDLQVDSTNFMSTGTNSSTYGSAMLAHGTSAPFNTGASSLLQLVTVAGWFTGLTTSATHSVRLMYKTGSTNSQVTIYNNTSPQVYMMLKED